MFSVAVFCFGEVVCLQLQEGALCLIVGSAPSCLALVTEHETRGCVVATRDKTTLLVPAGARIVYFTQSSFMQLSVALSLHFGWDSQLNTCEMFWIDISRWMIRSRCRWISVYLPWRTAHCF